MLTQRAPLRRICLLAALSVALGGCAFVADFVNPQVFPLLGIEADALTGNRGVVLIVFNNTTQSDATFFGFSAKNASDLSRDSRNFSTFVPAGENRNEVIECPVDVLGSGQIDADSVSTTAAIVGTAAIAYDNGVLESGSAFVCGDVIEVRLVATGAGTDQNAFSVVVLVLPGQ